MSYIMDLKKKMYERQNAKLTKKLGEAKVEAGYAKELKEKNEKLESYKKQIKGDGQAKKYFEPLKNVGKAIGKMSEESYYLGNAMLGTPVDRKKPLKAKEKELLWGK